MKPIITRTDYDTLRNTIMFLPPMQKTKEVQLLFEELQSGDLISDSEIKPDVIRLNSYFEVEDEKTKKVLGYTITLPNDANLKEKKISVLSPLGIALIGFSEGMLVDCALPAGNKKLKILKVEN
ncbi:MAG TPA: GreA/GreB family elongation factor [Chitinophagales bacterium]|nr:GreA/GreB family elongation factor [Chitinophagales bacterium]HRP38613.1 GreA/GreB family elongation factor [Chitinophagales bacterium]